MMIDPTKDTSPSFVEKKAGSPVHHNKLYNVQRKTLVSRRMCSHSVTVSTTKVRRAGRNWSQSQWLAVD